MVRRVGIGVGVLVAALAFAGSALAEHSAEITNDEAKCQQRASLGLSKFMKKKWQCISQCERAALAGEIDPAECVPPYSGTAADCIINTAEPKARNKLTSGKCVADCPECYAGGDCAAFADSRVAALEGEIDILKGLVYCDDSGSPDGLTKWEKKCRDVLARHLRNFAHGKMRCLRKCRKDEHRGKSTGSCDPAQLSDAKAVRCVDRQAAKAVRFIDKKCSDDRGEIAECHANAGLTTGAGWVSEAQQDVDDLDPLLFCVDPAQP
jgi:hypothetical protein